ncbi:NADPH:quinone reductase [Thalassotalea agarivorans]|uniref:NADPH:quinone reductase n=1 Tax=Thalassotalea agarivorans TaxID=349064 RepID=A0A1I0DNC2_THASX|nr:NADPH:quinone reductase [Thalassotalea agarivorans]SET33842.1 NADPH:quinone reductase [Thalassotalea agarivorans]
MKAAWFESFGKPADSLIIGEIDTPTAGPGEVLVRMHTSGVNPSDTKKRDGAFPNLLDGGLVIPHSDGAGIIEAVGEGVDTGRIGERVWLYQAQFGRRLGTAAQYVAIDASRAPKLPEQASFAVGAVLGIPVMTAHRCVFADGDVKGQTILVTGGAGRVGYYAIQWAKRAGATVIATASNDADKELCLSLGADHVVNHRSENWSADVVTANGGDKIDRVVEVEFGQNLPEVLNCIRVGGVIATYSSVVVPEPQLPFKHMMFMDLTLRLVIVYAMPESAKQDAIADIDAVLTNDEFSHRIAHEVSLDDIVKSHELIEAGGFGGCVVVNID